MRTGRTESVEVDRGGATGAGGGGETDGGSSGLNGRNETEKERLDRNLNELLGELRVIMPGVQVLFAFLLAVPFNQRFGMITGFQQGPRTIQVSARFTF